MKSRSEWQEIAERLAESGWSWSRAKFSDRNGQNLHMAEAHNEGGIVHAVISTTLDTTFHALKDSIQAAK